MIVKVLINTSVSKLNKVYDYKDPNNKSMKDVKEGLERVKKIL